MTLSASRSLKLITAATLLIAANSVSIPSAFAQASSTQPVASSNPWDYNLYTFGNASSNGSTTDIAGRVAIGGNATFSGFSLASNQAGQSISNSNVNVVIGGNYSNSGTTTHGTVDVGGNAIVSQPSITGSLHANGNVTLTNYGTVSGNVTYGVGKSYSNSTVTIDNTWAGAYTPTQTNTTLPIDFSATNDSLKVMSASLASITSSSAIAVGSTSSLLGFNYSNAYGTGILSYTGDKSTVVFNMSASDFNSANYGWTINAGSAKSVIINVTGGSSILMQNGQMNLNGIDASHVLFNFTDATSIYQNSYGMYGSVLATNAAFTGAGGQFNGSLIVNTFNEAGGGTELHNFLYSGYVPSASAITVNPVPEPGVYVTAFSMFGLTGLSVIRGRRRAAAETKTA